MHTNKARHATAKDTVAPAPMPHSDHTFSMDIFDVTANFNLLANFLNKLFQFSMLVENI